MFLRLRTLLTHVNVNYVNKKEAREKVRSSNKKLSERKVYARTLVKIITRHWKSAMNKLKGTRTFSLH